MQITLKQIEALYWAARLGSFVKAADRLNMTQSAFSKRIIELETEIGEQLFDRSGPQARITDAGQAMIGQAEKMLALRDEILFGANRIENLSGTCRFGLSELMAMIMLPELVRRVRSQYPHVLLEPHVSVAQELLDEMERGDTDFAICAGTCKAPEVQSERVAQIPLVWCCAPDVIAEDALPLSRLSEFNAISMSARAGSSMIQNAWLATSGVRFRSVVETNSSQAVASLAAAGIGVALLAEPFVDTFVATGALKKLRIKSCPAIPDLVYFLHAPAGGGRALPSAVRAIALDILRAKGGTPKVASPAPPAKT